MAAHINYGAITCTVIVGIITPVLLTVVALSWNRRHSDGPKLQAPPTAPATRLEALLRYRRSLLALATGFSALVVSRILTFDLLAPVRLLSESLRFSIGLVSEALSVVAAIIAFKGIRHESRKALGVIALTFACWMFLVCYVLYLRGPWYMAE